MTEHTAKPIRTHTAEYHEEVERSHVAQEGQTMTAKIIDYGCQYWPAPCEGHASGVVHATAPEWSTIARPDCDGNGFIVVADNPNYADDCETCHGAGVVSK
jgi:hypothetical protein